MRFPPPARYYAPLLVLVFGLAATWLDYELNLATDLARIFGDIADQAEATGMRLAKFGERELARGESGLLVEDLAAWADEPWLKLAAIVDEHGVVLADSAGRWAGRPASETPLAPGDAAGGDHWSGDGSQGNSRGGHFRRLSGKRWQGVGADRADALEEARADARRQLRWVASAIALLCFSLWAALHFGFAARLARLARAVRDFGEGRTATVAEVRGGDEVQELSAAFAAMAAQLEEREAVRVRLERELIETTERERRRIGEDLHDGIGQQLTAASFATSALITALETTAPAAAAQAERLGGHYVFDHRGLLAKVVRREPSDLDWHALLENAAQDPPRAKVAKDEAPEPGWGLPESDGDAAFLRILARAHEWSDLELLLRALRELGAEPLLLSMPINGAWFDRIGISHPARDAYVQRLRALAEEYGMPLLDFEEHENDPRFLIDHHDHLSAEGWMYFNKALDDFFHGRVPGIVRAAGA